MANFSDASPLLDSQAVMKNCSDNRPATASCSYSTSRSEAQPEMENFSDVSPLSEAQAVTENCSNNRLAMASYSDPALLSKAQFGLETEMLGVQLVKKSIDEEARSEWKLLPMQVQPVEEKLVDEEVNTCISFNDDSIWNILSRFPFVDVVVRCKTACSSWETVIEDSSFVRAYHNPGAILHSCKKSETKRHLFHLNFSYFDLMSPIKRFIPLQTLDFTSPFAFSRMINGLMIWTQFFWPESINQYYVYNVFTKEQRVIPKVVEDGARFKQRYSYHLGYSSSTNEYKVLRLAFQFKENPPITAQVLTLKPFGILSTWRHVQVPDFGIQPLKVYEMVRSNEARTFSGNSVVSWFSKEGLIWFDFIQDRFQMVELPEDWEVGSDYSLFVRHRFNGGQGVAFFSSLAESFYVLEDGDKWKEESLDFPCDPNDGKIHLIDGKGSLKLVNVGRYGTVLICTRTDDGEFVDWDYDDVLNLSLCTCGTSTTWDKTEEQSPTITLLHDGSAIFQSIDDMLGGTNSIGRDAKELDFDILSQATNGYDFISVLGSGASGIVCKDIFGESSLSTVKMIKICKGKSKIENLEKLGSLRHRNLVQLQGWCIEKEFLFLVYEHMSRGSLDQLLFREDDDESNPMKWPQRFNIAAGLASVVTYLHRKHVIHGGIKISNVMLDASDNASLGDLGWAMFVKNDEGYHLAPEYLQSGTMTAKTDVFSYGVVILELASGRRQSDEEKVNLVDWISELHSKGKITEAADKRLNGEFKPREMKKLLLIGLSCANPASEKRPTMRTILDNLASADELNSVLQQHSAADPT